MSWLFRKTRAKYKTYHASEHYAFRNLVRFLEDRDEYKILNHLKIWLLKSDSYISSMQAFIAVYCNEALKKEYNNLEERANGNTTAIFSSSQFKTELKAARARYLKREQSAVICKKNTKISERWLNLTSLK